jgi:hypothetical protein
MENEYASNTIPSLLSQKKDDPSDEYRRLAERKLQRKAQLQGTNMKHLRDTAMQVVESWLNKENMDLLIISIDDLSAPSDKLIAKQKEWERKAKAAGHQLMYAGLFSKDLVDRCLLHDVYEYVDRKLNMPEISFWVAGDVVYPFSKLGIMFV